MRNLTIAALLAVMLVVQFGCSDIVIVRDGERFIEEEIIVEEIWHDSGWGWLLPFGDNYYYEEEYWFEDDGWYYDEYEEEWIEEEWVEDEWFEEEWIEDDHYEDDWDEGEWIEDDWGWDDWDDDVWEDDSWDDGDEYWF